MLTDLVNRSKPLGPDAQVLVLGGGYSGRSFVQLIRALGTPVRSTRRHADSPGADLVFDSGTGQIPNQADLKGVSHLLCTIPPTSDGQDPALSCLGSMLQELPLTWVGYLSTTGVYGDRQGAWVTEAEPANAGQERSRRRQACEKAWLNSGLPVQILRLPGIYGPGRSVLDGLRAGRARRIRKPDQVFCRVHVEDIAGACLHLIHQAAQGQRPPIVNVSDSCPAAPEELLVYAADLLGCDLPEAEPFDQACLSMSAMAQSFWSENRRVSNHLLCQQLGYQLLHPDYRSGLNDCLQQDSQSSS